MPVTYWEDIVGHACAECGKPASHWYGDIPLCCQCHGGDVVSAEETARVHEHYKRTGQIPPLPQAEVV